MAEIKISMTITEMLPEAGALDVWLQAGKSPAIWPAHKEWEVCPDFNHFLHTQEMKVHKQTSINEKGLNFTSHFENEVFRKGINACQSEPQCASPSDRGALGKNAKGNDTQQNMESKDLNLEMILEVELIDIVLHALGGVSSAVMQLEKLCLSCSVWSYKKSDNPLFRGNGSTRALEKILSDLANAGKIRCQLEKFMETFTADSTLRNTDSDDWNTRSSCLKSEAAARKLAKRQRRKLRNSKSGVTSADTMEEGSDIFGLINQAFVAALRSILLGHTLGLNTVTASIAHRKHPENGILCHHEHKMQIDGPLLSFTSQGISLIELYLHTSGLRMQLEALAAICLISTPSQSLEDGSALVRESGKRENFLFKEGSGLNSMGVADSKRAKAATNLSKFPKGAQLLTYLYSLLLEPNPLHMGLLRFLFACTWQPYGVFVRSWLFCATVKDPFREFIVEETESKVWDNVPSPSFLAKVCTELVRSGQQLQVLSQLPETRLFAQQLRLLDCADESQSASNGEKKAVQSFCCPCDEFLFFDTAFMPILFFSKDKLEKLDSKREKRVETVNNQFNDLFKELTKAMEKGKASLGKPSAKSGLKTENVITDPVNSLEVTPELAALETKFGSNLEESAAMMGFYWKEMESKSPAATQQCFYFDVESDQVLGLKTVAKSKKQELKDNSNAVLGDGIGQGHKRSGKWKPKESSVVCDTGQRGLPNNPESLLSVNSKDNVPNSSPSSRNTQTQPSADDVAGITCTKEISAFINVDERALLSGGSEKKVSLGSFDCEPFTYVTQSFIVNHKGGTNWPCTGLPKNPFLQEEQFHATSPHAYVCTYFDDTEEAWNLASHSLITSKLAALKPQLSLNRSRCKVTVFEGFYKSANKHSFSPYIPQLQETDIGFSVPTRNVSLNSSGTLPGKEKGRSPSTLTFDLFPFLGGGLTDLEESVQVNFLETCTSSSNLDYLERSVRNEIGPERFSEESRSTKSHSKGDITQFREKSEFLVTSMGKIAELSKGLAKEVKVPASQQPCYHVCDHSKVEGLPQVGSDQVKDDPSRGPFGGATWESSLHTHHNREQFCPETFLEDILSDEEIPFEVVVDRCIIQEILSQYNCISSFTVRLMQQRFNLKDHYMALHRYYFMEAGDWIDHFTAALTHYKRMALQYQHKQLELQAMLEAALQNSSCAEDTYAEHLHIAIDEAHLLSQTESISPSLLDHNRVGAFDFIMLNYNVDWPLSLVLTPKVFRLYNAIFSFLLRIKLSSHALHDIWRHLKLMGRFLETNKGFMESQQQNERFRVLQLFRQQIGHVVTTVAWYLQSQLLHTAWTKFTSSLENQVKDLHDLELVHCSYLEDALHQCFLSTEMIGVKKCIDNTMQCLLDFRANLNIAHLENSGSMPTVISDHLFSQVLRLKSSFGDILRQLNTYSAKPEGSLGGPSREFWIAVDFNGFLSDIFLRSGDCI